MKWDEAEARKQRKGYSGLSLGMRLRLDRWGC